MGHMGMERTLFLVCSRFYCPRMRAEVEQKVKTCSRCVRRKVLPQKSVPLVNIQATRPLQLVCIDCPPLEPDKSNTHDILVITDFFTKYSVAIPMPNQEARTSQSAYGISSLCIMVSLSGYIVTKDQTLNPIPLKNFVKSLGSKKTERRHTNLKEILWHGLT